MNRLIAAMLKTHPAKLILCANHQQLFAGYWLADMLQSSFTFQNDASGHVACIRLLEQYSHCLIYLIADARDEDYRLENLPHTSGKTKSALILRKLDQFYRGLDYRTAVFLNRQKDQRQDDRYLFYAINNRQFLQNWLSLIHANNNLLVGIYPIAMLSQCLYKDALNQPDKPHSLLCEQFSSGIRQTYFYQGHLQFSRFVASDPLTPLHRFYQEETEKMRRYLVGQHLIEADRRLHLMFATSSEKSAIPNEFWHEQTIDYLNYFSLAKTKQLARHLILQSPELLHMQLIADGHTVANLANDSLLKLHYQHRQKHLLNKVTTAIALLGLITAGVCFYLGAKDQAELQKTTDRIASVQVQYDAYKKQWPASMPDGHQLKAAVMLDLALAKASKSPRRVMQVLSAALDKSPTTQVNQLIWQTNQEMMIDEQESAIVSIEIADDSTAQQKKNTIARFITDLKNNPAVSKVNLLSVPTDPKSLAGNTVDEKTNLQSQEFKLTIELKPVHAAPVLEGNTHESQ